MLVVGDQLPGLLVTTDEVVLNKADQSICVGVTLILEIKSIMHFFDIKSLLVGVVAQDKLL